MADNLAMSLGMYGLTSLPIDMIYFLMCGMEAALLDLITQKDENPRVWIKPVSVNTQTV